MCLYKERDLLERLLTQCDGCYDDLIVVHDGVEYQNLNGESGECGKSFKASAIIPSVRYSPDWQTPESLSLKKPEAPSVELALDYAKLAPNAPMPTGYRLFEGDPLAGSIHELVAQHGGSFYEGPRCFQQEPHWPFAKEDLDKSLQTAEYLDQHQWGHSLEEQIWLRGKNAKVSFLRWQRKARDTIS